MTKFNQSIAFLIDLDGTIYHGDQAINGAIEFIRYLNQHAVKHLFVTNRGNRPPEIVANSLQNMGLDCAQDNILTSAMACADQLKKNDRVYWIGEQGLDQAMANAGVVFDDVDPQIVVVGYDRDFNYQKLTTASRFILGGARFLATNDDRIITVEDGVLPEAGPIVAAITTATGVKPQIIGKPHSFIVEAALNQLNVPAEQCIIIGDNVHTDILAGVNNNLRSALVLTGVSNITDLDSLEFQPTWIVQDLFELQNLLLAQIKNA